MQPTNVLETTKLTRRFGELVAVDAMSIQVGAGQVFGLLGSNGAGKTTAIKMLTTLLPPTSGTATVAGFDICREASKVRRMIGYVPQMISADGNLTGYDGIGTDFAVLVASTVVLVAIAARVYPRVVR